MSKKASRRKNKRQGCCVKASLTIGQHVFQAILNNFCLNGFLVDCKPEIAENLADEVSRAQGQVDLVCHIEGIKYEITLEVRRASQSFFGLYCAEGLPALLYAALLQHAKSQVHQVDSIVNEQGRCSSGNRRRLLAQDIILVFDQALLPALNRYFERLPESLMKSAEKSLQSNQVQHLFEVSQRIKTQQSAMCRQFATSIRRDIVSLLGQSADAAPLDDKAFLKSELSLVEATQFDQWMATKATAQRIENEIDQSFRMVMSRLQPIVAHPQETCIFPQGQVKILQNILAKYQITGRSIRIALDGFAQETIPHYELYMSQLGELLEQKGYFSHRAVSPSIQRGQSLQQALPSKSNLKAMKQQHTSHNEPVGKSDGPHDYLENAKSSLARVSTLLSSLRAMPVLNDVGLASEETLFLSRQDLLVAVIALFQARLLESDHEHMNVALLFQLETNAEKKGLRISSSDHMAIELVDLFFNEIIKNEYLIEGVRLFFSKIRPIFLYDFLKKIDEKEISSEFQIVVFSLQEIAHEPLVWTGVSRKNLQNSFEEFLKKFTTKNSFSNINVYLKDLKKIIHQSLVQMNNVRKINQKRVVEAAHSRFVVQQKRNVVQVFLQGFVTQSKLVPKWFEQLMRMGWCEHLSYLSIRALEKEYLQAINHTKIFFDVMINCTAKEVAIDDALQAIVRNIADTFCSTLKECNASEAITSRWRAQIEDIINHHKNELLHMVPPSHWLIFSTDSELKNISAYIAHKISTLEVGSWVYCPHQVKMKRYLKVAWVAPDQSRYLLVNYSFIVVGDVGQEELVELLLKPGTRIVLEAHLPFKSKGIEYHFHSIYDKIRGRLLREQVTGFLDKLSFEQEVQSLIDNERLVMVVFIRILEEQGFINAYGSEFNSKFIAAFSKKLSHVKFNFNENKHDFIFSNFARFDEHFAFCLEQKKESQSDLHVKHSLIRFSKAIEENTRAIEVAGIQCNVTFKLGCVDASLRPHGRAALMLLAAEAAFQNAIPLESEHNNIYYALDDHFKAEELKQAQFAWIHSLTQETLEQHFSFNMSTILQSSARHYIKFTPVCGSDSFINELAQSNKSLLFNQWVIQRSLDLYKQNYNGQYTDIIVCIVLPQIINSAFFEIIFNAILCIKNSEKIHFCFDTYQLPESTELQDFFQEIKSYGCQLMLSRWGRAKNSFEALLGNSFDWVFLDPEIAAQSSETRKKLVTGLESLARASEVEIVSPMSSLSVLALLSSQCLKENKI